MSAQILTISAKGQISLPISIRKLPSVEEFEASLYEAQKWALSVGYIENDVDDIIKSVR